MEKLLVVFWRCEHFALYSQINACRRGEPVSLSIQWIDALLAMLVQRHAQIIKSPYAWRVIVTDAEFLDHTEYTEMTWLALTTNQDFAHTRCE